MLNAAILMIVLGAILGCGLGFADRFLSVEVDERINKVSEMLKDIPEEEKEEIVEEVQIKDTSEFEIKFENNIYVISGKVVEKVMRNINFDDYESVQYFQRFLDMKGINKQLEKMGINEGDTVRIGEVEFEYIR